MNNTNGHLITGVGLALVLLFAGVGCDQEGPGERAGERVDQAVENTGDAIENTGDKMKDAAEEAGDKVEDATDQ